MSKSYEDRVKIVVAGDAPDLRCAIGSHAMDATITVNDTWVYTTVDGYPICPDHVILIADARTPTTIPESRIKRVLIDNDEARARKSAQDQLRAAINGSQAGWIYYLSIDNLVKIGYTRDLQQRLSAYPPNSRLLALHPGTKDTEHDIHSRFVELRARGREWFRSGGQLDRHIEAVIAQFGQPGAVFRPMRHARVDQRQK
ncbi:GIY-YIG nuclease family protein [Microbacterium sp. KKR3/1]|uniref:GIY-YIG nuclease family protein n=1 Tax=Microbacterium sp. KKR3/1 TaxID=2904241 RepID=UPI001E567FC3|nr:GIY-YIG nuclease family protein [Microbacterium sp. KKR3/1]MCE0510860.1 GIY-YIG nuclease family protein [Microbacterium sp. KKR3/1]